MITHGDAFAWLDSLDDESVDLCVTDPPYESLEKHRARGTTTRLKHSKASSNDWFKTIPNARLGDLLAQIYRVLKPNSHCYIFCDDETSNIIWQLNDRVISGQKFKWWKRLVWDKMKMGMGYHYRASYEFIIFLEKGKRPLNDKGIRDVISVPRIRNSCLCTSTPKDTSKSMSTDEGNLHTFSYGKKNTDRFQEDSNFITKTETKKITESKIYNSSNQQNTNESILDVSCGTESGGSHVVCVENSSQSIGTIGTFIQNTQAGRVLESARHVTSRLSLNEKNETVCSDCGKRIAWPTEKPVEVSEVLIRQSSEPGDLVIDPFCGSGSVGAAATSLGRHFDGCDICAEAVEIARKRCGYLIENLEVVDADRGDLRADVQRQERRTPTPSAASLYRKAARGRDQARS